MTQINLLPWREELRKERNKIFAISCFVPALLAFLILFFLSMILNQMIAFKKTDEDYLNQELSVNQSLIKEVEDIDLKKKELLERVSIIQTLQNDRIQLVRLLDTLAKVTPDGVIIEAISQKGKQVVIKGFSDSNNAISSFMRDLDKLSWIASIKLTDVRESAGTAGQVNTPGLLAFSLTIDET